MGRGPRATRATETAEPPDRAVLRKAAKAVHRPDDAELAELLPATNGAGI
ncbi:hypothetical protein [Streptomyces canus]|nr:hypothetical protein [Streptomyces canus]MDQ0762653.1 hypothetical protein [Streptomyces canus]MDQ1068904.1 hypothetical protein [Streptomyces canus]